MKRVFLSAWYRTMRRVGPTGIAGVGLLLAALLTACWIPQVMRQGQALRAAAVARASASKTEPVAVVHRVPVDQQVREFVAAFPPMSQNPSDLNELFLSAKRRNLQLPRGEYQLKQEASSPLLTFTATFPVTSDYASIKDFSADVMDALPHVSLDELRMTRHASGSTVLDSIIRFSFVYRRA